MRLHGKTKFTPKLDSTTIAYSMEATARTRSACGQGCAGTSCQRQRSCSGTALRLNQIDGKQSVRNAKTDLHSGHDCVNAAAINR